MSGSSNHNARAATAAASSSKISSRCATNGPVDRCPDRLRRMGELTLWGPWRSSRDRPLPSSCPTSSRSIWRLRRQLLAPWIMTLVTKRRAVAVYATVVALLVGSSLVPKQVKDPRYPVTVADGGRFASLTMDGVLLADVLDRGIEGIRLLSTRQQRAVKTYIDSTAASLSAHLHALPKPTAGESMILGFADLHCNQATTELISRLARVTKPSLVLSSGDDIVDGTAVVAASGQRPRSQRGAAPGGDRKPCLRCDRGSNAE